MTKFTTHNNDQAKPSNPRSLQEKGEVKAEAIVMKEVNRKTERSNTRNRFRRSQYRGRHQIGQNFRR